MDGDADGDVGQGYGDGDGDADVGQGYGDGEGVRRTGGESTSALCIIPNTSPSQ